MYKRQDFKIGKFGDDVRWESLDEDIHISSFFDTAETDYENEIAMIFKRFPQLNVSEGARSMGINKSLLSKYIYGIKKPSDIRKMQIKEALHLLGKELLLSLIPILVRVGFPLNLRAVLAAILWACSLMSVR